MGLTPNCELALEAGCAQSHVPELGGWVAVHDEDLMTAIPNVFIAGDASGIEEASTAMLEGRLAGVAAAERLRPDLERRELGRLKDEARRGLQELRAGPFGERPRIGKRRMLESWKREAVERK